MLPADFYHLDWQTFRHRSATLFLVVQHRRKDQCLPDWKIMRSTPKRDALIATMVHDLAIASTPVEAMQLCATPAQRLGAGILWDWLRNRWNGEEVKSALEAVAKERDEAIEGHWPGTLDRILNANKEGYEAGKVEARASAAALVRSAGCVGHGACSGGWKPEQHSRWCPITLAARIEAGEGQTHG